MIIKYKILIIFFCLSLITQAYSTDQKIVYLNLDFIIQKNNKPDMILFSGETFNEDDLLAPKINLKFTLQGNYSRDDKLITQLFKKNEILPQASRYITKGKLWSKNNLSRSA